MNEEEEETIRKLLHVTEDSGSTERKRWKFNGEFNLGHVFTILSIIGGATLFWSTSQLKQQDHEFRIQALEKASTDFKTEMAHSAQQTSDALSKLGETQAQAIRNQDKLSLTLDFLAKQQARP